MCTAHPTTVLPAAAMMTWAGLRAPGALCALRHAAVAVTVVTAGLLPMVYAQWKLGFADFASTVAYTGSEWSQPSLFEGFRVIRGVVLYGPMYIAHFCLELSPPVSNLLLTCYAMALGLAGLGLVLRIRRDPRAKPIALALAAMLLHSIFLAAIRISMPPWMIFANWGMFAGLVALGLRHWVRYRAGCAAVSLLLCILIGWSTAAQVRLM